MSFFIIDYISYCYGGIETHLFHNYIYLIGDYISYCYGGIETTLLVSIKINIKNKITLATATAVLRQNFLFPYQFLLITLATATAVLRQFIFFCFIHFKKDYISYCYGGIETPLLISYTLASPPDYISYCYGGIETNSSS